MKRITNIERWITFYTCKQSENSFEWQFKLLKENKWQKASCQIESFQSKIPCLVWIVSKSQTKTENLYVQPTNLQHSQSCVIFKKSKTVLQMLLVVWVMRLILVLLSWLLLLVLSWTSSPRMQRIVRSFRALVYGLLLYQKQKLKNLELVASQLQKTKILIGVLSYPPRGYLAPWTIKRKRPTLRQLV